MYGPWSCGRGFLSSAGEGIGWVFSTSLYWVSLISLGIAIAQVAPTSPTDPLSNPTTATVNTINTIQSAVERLTVVGILALVVIGFWREWIVPGSTVEKRVTHIQATSDKRVEEVRKEFERQRDDKERELDRSRQQAQLEFDRVRSDASIEHRRMQEEAEQWRRIAMGTIQVSERQSRIVERGVIQGMMRKLPKPAGMETEVIVQEERSEGEAT